jgi:hypothetical protein
MTVTQVKWIEEKIEHPSETRILSKIPGKEENVEIPDHAELGKIICFARKDIVRDFMISYLKFFAECNLMANKGGESVPSSTGETLDEIAFGNNDLHPRHIGIAFFDFASNAVANWEDSYITLCRELIERHNNEKVIKKKFYSKN